MAKKIKINRNILDGNSSHGLHRESKPDLERLRQKNCRIEKACENHGEYRTLSRVGVRGQARVWTIDKLDEARTNAYDQMMLVQHYSGDRVMSYRGFDRIS